LDENKNNGTVELRLSGLIGTTSHMDMQKNGYLDFCLEIGYTSSFEILL